MLELRVRDLEDLLEIQSLVAAYGPAVDSGAALAAAALWTESGSYDVDTGRYEGRAGIADMVASPGHQRLLDKGCAHVTGAPQVQVDGDAASAVCHSQLLVRREDGRGFDVVRATAHRWELVRTPEGWRVAARTGRLLDGSETARALLRPGGG